MAGGMTSEKHHHDHDAYQKPENGSTVVGLRKKDDAYQDPVRVLTTKMRRHV
jgi:hypothetical protein